MKKLMVLITILILALLLTACGSPESEVMDEADMSPEEAATLAATEGDAEEAVEEAADEAERAAEEAADEVEKAAEEAVDEFEKALRDLEDLDADASEAEMEEAFAAFEAASEEALAAAEAAGVEDIDGLEQALDEPEQQIRDGLASGEPLQFQKDFLNAWFDAVFN